MKNPIFMLVAVITLMMTTPAVVGQLSKEEASMVRKASIQADKAERDIERTRKDLESKTADGAMLSSNLVSRLVRNMDNVDSALEKAEGELTGATDAAELLAVQTRLASLSSEASITRAAVNLELERINAHEAAMLATASADLPLIEGLIESVRDYANPLNIDVSEDFRPGWPHVITAVETYVSRYQEPGSSDQTSRLISRTRALASQMESTLYNRDVALQLFTSNGPYKMTGIERAVDETIAQQAWGRLQREVFLQAAELESQLDAFVIFADGTNFQTSTVVPDLRKRLATMRDKINQYEAQTIAENTPTPDVFPGSNSTKLKAFARSQWLISNPGHKVLQVNLINPDWQRNTRWEWSNANSSWELHDYSKLMAEILIDAGDGSYAYRYLEPLFILHLDGDALASKAWQPGNSKPGNPFDIIPLSAL